MLWCALILGGCDRSSANSGNGPGGKKASDSGDSTIRIVATTGMVGDMVSALVGDWASVESIMGPGVDPHLHQASRGDSVKLRSADIVIYNGLHLEGRLGEVLESRADAGAVTIAVGELLPHDRLIDADAGVHDPHIWMDVSLWSEAVAMVAVELAKAMPEHAGEIMRRTDRYRSELAVLDTWGQSAIESIAENQRVLVTAHDAFRYFGRRYGVEVHGVQGVSTISDAAIRDINRLVDLIASRKVSAVFFESSVSGRQVEAIVEGARRKGVDVSSDWVLLSDSMGASGTPSGNYIGMMRHNFETITTALGGTVPEFTVPEFPQISQPEKGNSVTDTSPASDFPTGDFPTGDWQTGDWQTGDVVQEAAS